MSSLGSCGFATLGLSCVGVLWPLPVSLSMCSMKRALPILSGVLKASRSASGMGTAVASSICTLSLSKSSLLSESDGVVLYPLPSTLVTSGGSGSLDVTI